MLAPTHPCFFFFNDTATTEIYTLSLHDALPISHAPRPSSTPPTAPTTSSGSSVRRWSAGRSSSPTATSTRRRSEEHTSELQSHSDLVCRLLLEKKTSSQHPATSRIATASYTATA